MSVVVPGHRESAGVPRADSDADSDDELGALKANPWKRLVPEYLQGGGKGTVAPSKHSTLLDGRERVAM
eukprot:8108283-Pyramimonas_sp.AAC.1